MYHVFLYKTPFERESVSCCLVARGDALLSSFNSVPLGNLPPLDLWNGYTFVSRLSHLAGKKSFIFSPTVRVNTILSDIYYQSVFSLAKRRETHGDIQKYLAYLIEYLKRFGISPPERS